MIAAVELDFRNFVVAAFVIVVAMVLAYRLMRRDENVRRTRYGFFIERDRFEPEGPPCEPDSPLTKSTHRLDPENEETKLDWPQREEDA